MATPTVSQRPRGGMYISTNAQALRVKYAASTRVEACKIYALPSVQSSADLVQQAGQSRSQAPRSVILRQSRWQDSIQELTHFADVGLRWPHRRLLQNICPADTRLLWAIR